MFINTLWENFLELLFPSKCLCCGKLSGEVLCPICRALAFEYYGEAKQLKFDDYLAVFKYAGPVKQMLDELKFKKNLKVLSYLQNALLEKAPIYTVDMIIPVPLNPLRYQERGFNQAELLIKKYADFNRIPLRQDILFRGYNTTPSYQLTRKDRAAEKSDAFGIWENKRAEIPGKKILLFDDILTTGSTIRAMITLLEQYQPQKITVLAFSRPEQKIK